MKGQLKREAQRRTRADRIRDRLSHGGKPTAIDQRIAAGWYPLLSRGELTEGDLAKLLTSVRYDAELVRRLEVELTFRKGGRG